MTRAPVVEVRFIADVACAWSFLAWRALVEAAQKHDGAVRLHWIGFFAPPPAPPPPIPDAARAAARQAGIELVAHLAPSMTTTLAAHRLIRLAASHGAAEAVISRLFSAILCEGLDASALAALTALSEEAGLPAGEVRAALAGDEGAAEVLAAAAAALAQGVRGTPIAIIGAEAMPGACSAADYAAALGRASR